MRNPFGFAVFVMLFGMNTLVLISQIRWNDLLGMVRDLRTRVLLQSRDIHGNNGLMGDSPELMHIPEEPPLHSLRFFGIGWSRQMADGH